MSKKKANGFATARHMSISGADFIVRETKMDAHEDGFLPCDVSLIFVNFNTSGLLADALASFLRFAKGFSYEIIIVDNSCSEVERERLELICKAYKCTCLFLPVNAGFGMANNEGASVARGQYLHFVNCDTVFESNATFELLSFMRNNPRCGIAGSNLLDADGLPNFSFSFEEKNLENEIKRDRLFRKSKEPTYNYTNTPLKIKGFVSGASLMIRKGAFVSVGGFPKEIFLYSEEAFLCYSIIHNMGLDVYNVPSSRIVHLEGKSFSSNISLQRIRFSCDGNYQYYRLLFGSKTAKEFLKKKERIFFRNAVVLFLFMRFTKSRKFSLFHRVYREKRRQIEHRRDDESTNIH